MIGSLSDALIMIIVAILLLGGEKNLSGTMRNLGRTLSELRKRQNDFKNELMRELSDTGEVTQDIKGSLSFDSEIRPMVKSVSKVNYQPVDPKIQQLENEIRRLQAELERLKKGDGKKTNELPKSQERPLLEHLNELIYRARRALISLVVAFVIFFFFLE